MGNSNELRRMKRQELLELLLEVTKENEFLKEKVETLEKQLASREIAIEESGSIAEASLKLSGIFESAQQAADDYLFNLKKRGKEAEEIKPEI